MKVTKKELFYNEFSDEWENKINKLETEKRLKVVFGEFLKRIGLNGKKFLVASASKLPFKDESFDIVLCTEVIEHVDDQSQAIEEMFRVIKEGGILVITSPNRFFKPLFDLLSKIGVRPYHGNETWFYPSALKGILSRKGRVLKEYYFNFLFPIDTFSRLEKFKQLKNLMINQGYIVKKD